MRNRTIFSALAAFLLASAFSFSYSSETGIEWFMLNHLGVLVSIGISLIFLFWLVQVNEPQESKGEMLKLGAMEKVWEDEYEDELV